MLSVCLDDDDNDDDDDDKGNVTPRENMELLVLKDVPLVLFKKLF